MANHANDLRAFQRASFNNFGVGTGAYEQVDAVDVRFHFYIVGKRITILAIYRGISRVIRVIDAANVRELAAFGRGHTWPYEEVRRLHLTTRSFSEDEEARKSFLEPVFFIDAPLSEGVHDGV